MPVISDIPVVWTTLAALTVAETWQCRTGTVAVTRDTPGGTPDPDLGILLRAGEVYPGTLPVGAVVSYRRVGPNRATLHREAAG